MVDIAMCPNDPPCPHSGMFHDIYETDDPYPTCCEEGCRCGHPGEAILRRHSDGTVTVARTDPVIRVSADLLLQLELDGPPGTWSASTMVLTLDTAGEYRYRALRPDPSDSHIWIFGRVKDAAGELEPGHG